MLVTYKTILKVTKVLATLANAVKTTTIYIKKNFKFFERFLKMPQKLQNLHIKKVLNFNLKINFNM